MIVHEHRLVIGVIGNDIHVVANKVLERGLRNAGYDVCNIGVNTFPEDFIDAAVEHDADAVIVSTINGEGEDWVHSLREELTTRGLKDAFLYIGGNLAIGDQPRERVEAKFCDMGFSRAYHRPESMDIFLTDIAQDLAQ